MTEDQSARTQADIAGPTGIGGWLTLPFLGLVIAPIRIVITVYREVLPAFEAETWFALTTPGNPVYHPSWELYLVGALLLNILVVLAAVLLLILGLQKRRLFPRLMIAYYLICVFTASIDVFAVNGFLAAVLPEQAAELRPEVYRELMRAMIMGVIWSSYFALSQRVKNTFTN